MAQPLLHPEDVRARCVRLYARGHLAWLGAARSPGTPHAIALGAPTQAQAAADPAAVRDWAAAWQAWEVHGQPGRVTWEARQWPRLGAQRLPVSLVVQAPDDVAALAGEAGRWQRAAARHARLVPACPWLAGRPAPQRLYDALAEDGDADCERLLALMQWWAAHPASDLLLRQLPVPGMDTKWVEQHRGLIVDLLAARTAGELQDAAAGRDLHALLGLRKAPVRLRLRVLDPALREALGGLGDVEAPVEQLAALPLAPRLALVVENLESGLALPEMAGCVALMKLGHAVNLLAQLPWLRAARVVVWGDIDTHGLAIVDRVRAVLPQATSMLMDPDTLLGHRALWGEEPRPYQGPALERLGAEERCTYEGLVGNAWGARLRLEQERIPWAVVQQALARIGAGACEARAPESGDGPKWPDPF